MVERSRDVKTAALPRRHDVVCLLGKTLDILEHFLFWLVKEYLGIALTYLGIFITVCNLGIFRALAFSEPYQTSTMSCFAEMFKCVRICQLSATRY